MQRDRQIHEAERLADEIAADDLGLVAHDPLRHAALQGQLVAALTATTLGAREIQRRAAKLTQTLDRLNAGQRPSTEAERVYIAAQIDALRALMHSARVPT